MGLRQGRALGVDGPPWILGMDGTWGEMGLRLGRWHRWASNDGPSAWMGPYGLWALEMDGLRAGMDPQHKWALEMD